MAPTVASAFSDFVGALAGIATQLFNSILAVCQAFLALGKDIIGALVQLVQSVVKLGFDVFQGAIGFVAANFLAVLVIGGGYYWYTTQQQRGVKKSK